MSLYAGITGTATIGGQDFTVSGWRLNNPATILTFVNSKSGLHPQRLGTLTDLTFDIDIDLDSTAQPFAANTIIAGATLGTVFLQIAPGYGWTISAAVVSAISQSLARGGYVRTTLACALSGTISPPGGSGAY